MFEGKAKKLIAQPGLLDWLGDLIKVGPYDEDRQIVFPFAQALSQQPAINHQRLAGHVRGSGTR